MSRSQALLAALALVAAAFFANLLLTLFGGRVDLTEDPTGWLIWRMAVAKLC